MGTETDLIKKPAPTLYVIIAIKLLKGLLFVGLAAAAGSNAKHVIVGDDASADVGVSIEHVQIEV